MKRSGITRTSLVVLTKPDGVPEDVDLSEMAIGIEEELAGGNRHRENDATGGDERKVRDVELSDGNTARRLARPSPTAW